MLRIVSHLDCLLMMHDCVIVPRFGGFVLHTVPALYRANDHHFRPIQRDIVFNTTLRYNDGLLTESYMKMYGLDYHKAYRMIENDVEEIKTLLHKGQEVELGSIGSFRLGDEGQIVFHPAESGFQCVESYGLSSFKLKTIHDLQREESARLAAEVKKPANDKVLYIPINKKWLRGIAGTAAAVALFLLVSTPVKQIDTNAYTANFIPTEVVLNSKLPSVAITTPTVKEEAPVVSTPTPTPATKQLYYVVVSSVNSVKQADMFISQMDKSSFPRVNKLVENKKVRVYTEKFDSREKADTYMAKLRKNPKYQDAWVYIP